MPSVTPVILSGGSGTRLWPISRKSFPKQLQPLFSDRSMLVETAERVSGNGFNDPVIICNAEHRFIIAEELLKANIPLKSIVLEPVGRGTAPASAIAALLLVRDDPDALMLILPSDHLVQNREAFTAACFQASQAAEMHALVTFGIVPKSPETGFGYVQKGVPVEAVDGCYAVERFVEKPDRETAENFIASGDYFWNSGIFLFRAQDYLDELLAVHPDMLTLCEQSLSLGVRDMDFFRLDQHVFAEIEGDSIDYAVMEKTNRAIMIPVDMGWDDVGSWSALWDVSDKRPDGNVIMGDVIIHDVQNSYVRSSRQLVAALGVRNVIIVATDDAILVADMDYAQNVKDVVETLHTEGRDEHLTHTRVYRPWGWYETMETSTHYQVKQLTVKPGGVLSLQSHKRRSEHWVVVAGVAHVLRDEDEIVLHANQSTYIPPEMKHRLENRGEETLYIIEVQSGSYLGEDDIQRYEDIYGRR